MLVLELGCKGLIDHLAFSPNGRALVATANDEVVLWSALKTGHRVEWVSGGKFALRPRFSANGRWIFGGLSTLLRFDPKAGTSVAFEPWADSGVEFDVSPTKPLLLVTRFEVGKRDLTELALWRATDLSPAGKVWQRAFDESPYRNVPQFLPGGKRFARVEARWPAKGSFECHVVVYDTATGEPVGKPVRVAHRGVLSPDGRWVAECDGTAVNLCPVDPAKKAGSIRSSNRKHFTGVAFHPSGKYLAATSNDTTVRLYAVDTGHEVQAFTWDIGRMRSIAFSPDGTLAAAGSDKGKVIVWDVDV